MNDKSPLISIIVPINNVAPYLRKCLDSLKGQTLKQIEVICIDDGSTDESGSIADEYVSEEWPIFRVVHTENRGLSAARNRGIDKARAEWIMFVDGDDWVDPKFCEIPYKTAIANECDLVLFEAYRVAKNGKVQKNKTKSSRMTGVINEMYAHEFGGIAVWKKIYKRQLIANYPFPEGRVYEEIATTHQIIHGAKKIIQISDRLYYYVERKGSITHSHNQKNVEDYLVSSINRYTDLVSYGFPKEKIEPFLCSSAIWYLTRTIPCKDELYTRAVEIISSIGRIPQRISYKKKMAILIWKTDRRLFYYACAITGRLKESQNKQ